MTAGSKVLPACCTATGRVRSLGSGNRHSDVSFPSPSFLEQHQSGCSSGSAGLQPGPPTRAVFARVGVVKPALATPSQFMASAAEVIDLSG